MNCESLNYVGNEENLRLIESDEFRRSLNVALVQMGSKNVHKEYRHLWTSEKPYLGYCYVVSELLYHLLDKKATPKTIATVEGKHWFLELDNMKILDYTCDTELEYSTGVKRNFMTKEMSCRTKTLFSILQKSPLVSGDKAQVE